MIDQGTIATSASLTDLGGATTIIGLGTFGLALTGDSGNDKFIGTKGNDTIDGAGGSDTVVFSGNSSAYTRTNQPNGSIQIAGPDGTDTLSNVEFLQFADQTIAVGAATSSIVINDQSLAEGNNGTKVATFTVTRSGGGRRRSTSTSPPPTAAPPSPTTTMSRMPARCISALASIPRRFR